VNPRIAAWRFLLSKRIAAWRFLLSQRLAAWRFLLSQRLADLSLEAWRAANRLLPFNFTLKSQGKGGSPEGEEEK
jgi:hypothetical protein